MAKKVQLGRARDIKELATAAVAFDYSATVLEKQNAIVLHRVSALRTTDIAVPTLITSLINSALAIELYFKAIIQHAPGSQGFPELHLLKTLFDVYLDSRAQKSIRDHYDRLMPKGQVLLREMTKHFPPAMRPVIESVDDILSQSDDVFRKWRYYFQYDPKDCYWIDLRILRLAVRNSFADMKPDWADLIHRFQFDAI
jgi:hypothetical protein